jgi:hypothetical protein
MAIGNSQTDTACLGAALDAIYILSAAAFMFFMFWRILKHSFFLKGEQAETWITIGTTASTIMAFSVFFFAFFLRQSSDRYSVSNLIGISLILAVMEVVRILLDRHEQIALEGKSLIDYRKNVVDLAASITLYLGIYVAVLYSDRKVFTVVGFIMCGFNLFRVIKYRIYDDLYKRQMDISGSWLSPEQTGSVKISGHVTLIQGLYNVFLRTYFYVSTTFAFIYLLMVSNDTQVASVLFKFENSSGNLFVDFFFYSVFQLSMGGYGDIAPKAVVAKLTSATEMLFGYLFLGSILALILGRTSPGRA